MAEHNWVSKAHLTALSLCVVISMPPLAHAQASSSPSTPATADESGNLNEIIVTAQRRSEDVKEVPSSISVLSGEELAQSQISGFEDISRSVPGVSFSAGGGPGLDHIEMRGISSTSGSATVGLYLDDVPIAIKNHYNGAVEPHFLDFERVEILRGPQGTLFGASSEGGTIRFITHQPQLDQFSGSVMSELAGTKGGGLSYDTQAVINAPLITGAAAARLSVDIGEDAGWIDNHSVSGIPSEGYPDGGEKNTNLNRWIAGSASTKVAISDGLSVTGTLRFESQHSGDTSVYQPDLGLYQQAKQVREPSRDQLLVAALTLNEELSFAQLTAVSSYFSQHFDRTQDGTVYNSQYLGYLVDQDPPNGIQNQGYQIGLLPGPQYSTTDTRVVTQEVRLASTPGFSDKVSWIAGLFYSNYVTWWDLNPTVTGLASTFLRVYGIPTQDSDVFSGLTFPGDSVGPYRAREGETQYAGYLDVSYKPITALKISAGVRYSHTPTDFAASATGFFSSPYTTQNTSFNSTTPRFAATYDVTEEMTAYATISKGYRVGGAEGYIPPTLCQQDLANLGVHSTPSSYDSDSLWNYEGGIKGRFLDNRFAVNADFYYVNWSNIQQTVNLPICGYPLTTNVGDAKSYGPELELTVRPVEELTLGLSGTYTHAVLTNVGSSVGASNGDWILNVPEWMGTFRGEYARPISQNVRLFARADYDWTGPSRGAFSVDDPDYARPSYSVLNASIGADIGRWKLSCFAKNLLDDKKIIQHPSLLYVNEAYSLRPLTAGVRLEAKF